MKEISPYKPRHHIRIVTAASLFDGHDAAINIMRRIIQYSGAEVIHLGHDRSVNEIAESAIQEDAQAVAITSYQGGHVEFFKYLHDMLKEKGCGHIKIFGGGGGTILPGEAEELHRYGITRIYSPDDGRAMGLQGMINDLLMKCSSPSDSHRDPQRGDLKFLSNGWVKNLREKDWKTIARLISLAENNPDDFKKILLPLQKKKSSPSGRDGVGLGAVLGITGTGGAGKSSVIDELVRRFLSDFRDKTVGIISVDPTKRKTGGALLGDRIRMNSIHNDRVFMRSLATRGSNRALSGAVKDAIDIFKAANFDLIILESSGIGQSDSEIVDYCDVPVYVMTPDYGAPTQLEKIDMLDFAAVIALNKFDKRGAMDALRDVRKQFRRNRQITNVKDENLPVVGTIASQFNDPGMNKLYIAVIENINSKTGSGWETGFSAPLELSEKIYIIPPGRVRYLSEITETVRNYSTWVKEQCDIAGRMYSLINSVEEVKKSALSKGKKESIGHLHKIYLSLEKKLDPVCRKIIERWPGKVKSYRDEIYRYKVRGKEIKVKTQSESLSHTLVPKISVPAYESWKDIVSWSLEENVPGEFPFTAGVYPFKRQEEEPTRMFAGEGAPEKTNHRFHYLSRGMFAKRLSTAFDSVTLYGRNPDHRPDIYGKIGNSGVSVCCLDDAKKLYSGFNLADPKTSVSMTINGPASIITAFFMNAAIDQQCELYILQNGLKAETEKKMHKIFGQQHGERPLYNGKLPDDHDGLGLMLLGVTGDQVLPEDIYEKIKTDTLCRVRGTVQADILKEDQAQNTCIFSTEFSLKIMGDVQEYFIKKNVRNFYSVSISGYHIAEAGANPITQLALTLANGFTYVEYYLSRGMKVDDFAPNFSFFFSNGIDPEYAVIGRVARRIWAKAMKLKYHANERSQMLKYHIQTSGRSLHAQEIEFNDIRTTLQALYAIFDNCNSLHTNAFDEAITTPTEESVRRAVAIQLIINKELGLAKNENPQQGSFIIEELTDLVEKAVLAEFDRISERGGVLGAMETMYQRGKIQEESLYYESLKHSGDYPIMGVNTFLSSKGSPTIIPQAISRSTAEEKENQIKTIKDLHSRQAEKSGEYLKKVQDAALHNKNIFETLMGASKYCSLGQLTDALFEVGGQYRRNM
ncbi:MAG: methylmalonyl-CoA mutase family protein [Bacteroidetes bacterium]|nr:methylmalonyl-CoA mutase family protein [Bacteroidota bacterium]